MTSSAHRSASVAMASITRTTVGSGFATGWFIAVRLLARQMSLLVGSAYVRWRCVLGPHGIALKRAKISWCPRGLPLSACGFQVGKAAQLTEQIPRFRLI